MNEPVVDDDLEDEDLEFCSECGDTFRYDDCGGYNPPCSCGLHCRHCHELYEGKYDADDEYYPEDDHE